MWSDAMRCIWSDAMHMVRRCSCLYKKDRSDYQPMRCGAYGFRYDAVHMVGCDAVHMVRCDAYGPMRCIWSDAVLVCTKKINRITNRYDAVHMVGCDAVHMVGCDAVRCIWSDAVHMVRCDAVHMVRCCSCLYRKDQFDYKPMRCIWSDAMRCIWSDAMRCIWSDAVLVCTTKISRITNRCDAVHVGNNISEK